MHPLTRLRCPNLRTTLLIAGLALLVLGTIWWVSSIRKNRLVGGSRTWTPAYAYLGVDFLSSYHATKHIEAGGDPYVEAYGDPLNRPTVYAPAALWPFVWCRLLPVHAATVVWIAALASMATLAAVVAWRWRRSLGSWDLPWPFFVAAFLLSTPVVFAMERGNNDLLVLLLLLLAAAALRKQTLARDSLAGACLAAATWIKIYPALLVLALPALRRSRAVVGFAVTFAAIGLADVDGVRHFAHNLAKFAGGYDAPIHATNHSLTIGWKHLWENGRIAWLNHVPGNVAALGLLMPLAGWVSFRIYRCSQAANLALPYLVWLAGLATFLPQVANDYNLVYLPLAALIIWDRRDPVLVHLMMTPLLFWWQPVQLSIGPKLILLSKLTALLALGVSLIGRARELAASEVLSTPEPMPAPAHASAA